MDPFSRLGMKTKADCITPRLITLAQSSSFLDISHSSSVGFHVFAKPEVSLTSLRNAISNVPSIFTCIILP